MNSNSAPSPPSLDPASSKTSAEILPVSGILGTLDALLRRPRDLCHHFGSPRSIGLIGVLVFIALLTTALYGLVVGSFSGGMQWWAVPLKLAGGLVLCGVICLPSLYVFACLAGATVRLADVAGLVAGLVALLGILLVSFAPVAWVFSQSTNSVAAMGTLHLVFWLIATLFGVLFLRRGLARLGALSRGASDVWSVLLVLVMLQMMTALRPLVGTAQTLLPTEKRFFLQHWGMCLEQNTRN